MKRAALLVICVALSAQTQEPNIIGRAHAAGNTFARAWNEWARQHDPYTTSAADRERFKKVRKAWKEFERLYKEIE